MRVELWENKTMGIRNRAKSRCRLADAVPQAQRSRQFHEAHEPAEAANAALDQIERLAQEVLDAGGEFALRARMRRLLGSANMP